MLASIGADIPLGDTFDLLLLFLFTDLGSDGEDIICLRCTPEVSVDVKFDLLLFTCNGIGVDEEIGEVADVGDSEVCNGDDKVGILEGDEIG